MTLAVRRASTRASGSPAPGPSVVAQIQACAAWARRVLLLSRLLGPGDRKGDHAQPRDRVVVAVDELADRAPDSCVPERGGANARSARVTESDDRRERAVIDRDLLNARNAAEASHPEDLGSSRRGTRVRRDS